MALTGGGPGVGSQEDEWIGVIPTADRDDHGDGDTEDLEALRLRSAELEEEVLVLRRRLQEGPRRVQTLEEKLLEAKGQLAQAVSQNEKLTFTLQTAKEHIANLREEVEKLTQPPAAYGIYLGTNDDGTVDVYLGRPQDARLPAPRHRARRAAPRQRGGAQRVAQRGAGPRGRGRR